ncbi:hypothetical protein AAEX28_07605 [Lentisphaerota bacterium WC36G]|nr:hypothetical protein LJT99_10465 [Lentisphaerae bacterium WC36]
MYFKKVLLISTLAPIFFSTGCGMTLMTVGAISETVKADIASFSRPKFKIQEDNEEGDIFIATEDLSIDNCNDLCPIKGEYRRKYQKIVPQSTRLELYDLDARTGSNFPRSGFSHFLIIKMKVLDGEFKDKVFGLSHLLYQNKTLGYCYYKDKILLKKISNDN